MGKYLRISSILESPSSYMTLQPIPSKFPYIWGKFIFSFLSVQLVLKVVMGGFYESLTAHLFSVNDTYA
jgi:hypothetical protein